MSLCSLQRKKLFLCITLLFTDGFPKVLIATSRLISKFFEPKFALARRKGESVVVNCIAPMIAAELRQDLDKVILFPLLLMLRTEKSRDAGERGHDGCNDPCTFIRGAMGAEVPFYESHR